LVDQEAEGAEAAASMALHDEEAIAAEDTSEHVALSVAPGLAVDPSERRPREARDASALTLHLFFTDGS
jgi:hypothetical protein